MALISPTMPRNGTTAAKAADETHFAVLDSWRGICALLVALFHFPAANALSQSRFIASSYLFVDFFFVLSGFVIASSYATRLRTGGDARRFAIIRFGRIYPLHLVVLLAFVGFEALRLFLPQLRGTGPAPFTDGYDVPSLINNLALLQGVGFEDRLTWNAPSWSISAEFFTYLLFAAVMIAARARAWMVFVAVAAVAPVLLVALDVPSMDLAAHLGFLRCLYGFSVGALLAWCLREDILTDRKNGLTARERPLWTAAEVTMLAAIVIFVSESGAGRESIAAPLVFAAAIYLFAHEGGWISLILRSKPFLLLGAMSYSIYMVHIFIQARLYNVVALVDRKLELGLVGDITHHGHAASGFGPGSPVIAVIAVVAMLALTLGAAWLTWRFVEMPALAWFRTIANRTSSRTLVSRAIGTRLGSRTRQTAH